MLMVRWNASLSIVDRLYTDARKSRQTSGADGDVHLARS
jgi:hypothetical protein